MLKLARHFWQSWPMYWHVGRRINNLPFTLAHAVPRRWQYWIVNDVAARATTSTFSDRTPDEVGILELLEFSHKESARQ